MNVSNWMVESKRLFSVIVDTDIVQVVRLDQMILNITMMIVPIASS